MGIFSAIMDKLRNRAGTQTQGQAQGGQQQATASRADGVRPSGAAAGQAAAASGASSATQTLRDVDVDAVLSQLAQQKGGGGNYRQSIVDLLKLLDLDSSLTARKELAAELSVNAGEHGSAEQNIALHKAVMRKLADNGGKVPDSMRH